jgi:hypothetical protein
MMCECGCGREFERRPGPGRPRKYAPDCPVSYSGHKPPPLRIAEIRTCACGCGQTFTPATKGNGIHRIYATDNCRRRHHDRTAGRGVCIECGGQTCRKDKNERCRTCWNKIHDDRRALIEWLWADGAKLTEIADEIGVQHDSIGPEMARWRREGWNLPYRHNIDPVTKRRVAA